MIKEIVINPVKLSKVSERIDISDHKLVNRVIMDLVDTARNWRCQSIGCAGLAANQIGYMHRMIVFLYEGKFMVMINPEIIFSSKETKMRKEGCLSRPGVNYSIKRSKKIEVKFLMDDYYRSVTTMKFTGAIARVIQHEIDHLDGKFI